MKGYLDYIQAYGRREGHWLYLADLALGRLPQKETAVQVTSRTGLQQLVLRMKKEGGRFGTRIAQAPIEHRGQDRRGRVSHNSSAIAKR
jgi:hypothetical protein